MMECRVEAGTLGAVPVKRGGLFAPWHARPSAPPASASGTAGAGMADMGGLAAQMNAALGAMEKRAGAGGSKAAAERLDEDPEEALDDLDRELDDAFDEEPEDPEEDFLTSVCRILSSEAEMARHGPREVAALRAYLPKD
jgi:hypothetical protein